MDPTKDKTLEELLDGIKFDDDHMYGYEAGRVEPGYANTVIGGGYSFCLLFLVPESNCKHC